MADETTVLNAKVQVDASSAAAAQAQFNAAINSMAQNIKSKFDEIKANTASLYSQMSQGATGAKQWAAQWNQATTLAVSGQNTFNATLKATPPIMDQVSQSAGQAGQSVGQICQQFFNANIAASGMGRQVTQAANATNQSLQSLLRTSQGVSAAPFKKMAEESTNSLQAFRRSWFDVIAVMGAFTMAGMAVVKAFEALQSAAEFRGMVIATRNMANSFGVDMRRIMDALDEASNHTLTAQNKFRLMNEAMLAGGAEVADKLPQLVEIARAASIASGASFELVFQKMLLGIARGSAKLIDDARIYLRIGNVVEEYAKAHGIAAEAVDAHTRTTIIMNAVLEDGTKIVQAVGKEALTEADSFKQMTKAGTEFIETMKQIPVITGIVNGLTTALTAASQAAILWSASSAGAEAAYEAQMSGKTTAEAAQANLDARNRELKRLLPAVGIVVGGEPDERREAILSARKSAAEALAITTATENEQNERFAKLRDRRNELIIAAGQKMYDAEQRMLLDIEELNIDHANKLADIALAGARKREDIAIEFSQKIEDAETDYLRDLEDSQRGNANRRIEIEQRYQERLIQIQRRFEDEYWGAVKSRDAVGLVEAVRNRNRGIQDATRQRDQDMANADRDDAEKAQKAWITYQRKLLDARRYYDRAMDDQRTAEQRAVDEENRNNQFREAEIRRHYRWRIEEIRRNLQAELDEANAKYGQAESDYSAHLERMAQIAASYMALLGGYGGPTNWGGAYYGGSERYRAEGGVDMVSSPTRFMAGEAGPELVLTVPLGASRALPAPTSMSHTVSGDVSHQLNMITTQGMRGMEGRIVAAVMQAMREVVRR